MTSKRLFVIAAVLWAASLIESIGGMFGLWVSLGGHDFDHGLLRVVFAQLLFALVFYIAALIVQQREQRLSRR